MQVTAVSETHLDDTIENAAIPIPGYNVFRLDRDRFGGGVAFFIPDHIPVKIRNDLGMTGVEALWLQVYTSHQRPIRACCCYRPPSSNIEY